MTSIGRHAKAVAVLPPKRLLVTEGQLEAVVAVEGVYADRGRRASRRAVAGGEEWTGRASVVDDVFAKFFGPLADEELEAFAGLLWRLLPPESQPAHQVGPADPVVPGATSTRCDGGAPRVVIEGGPAAPVDDEGF